jgi:hypothetical protein
MKDATKFANDIAQKENDDALEEMKKSGKTEIITLTPSRRRPGEGARRRCTPKWSRASARTLPIERSTRKRASSPDPELRALARSGAGSSAMRLDTSARYLFATPPQRPGTVGGFLRILDRLEEWLIASLMGAATLLIFVAVVHRYASGVPIPLQAG